jgi:hypothetical protein
LLAADLLLHLPDPLASAVTLFRQGDGLERRMILKALAFLPVKSPVTHLLLEAHRSNDEELFDAGLLDSDLPARALATPDYNNLVLKAAFLSRPLGRLFSSDSRANPKLSQMLLDFLDERSAAGRTVWPHTFEMVALAPVDGFADRLQEEAKSLDEARSAVARRLAQQNGIPLCEPQ